MATALLDNDWLAEIPPIGGAARRPRGRTGPLKPGTGPLKPMTGPLKPMTAPLVAPVPLKAKTGPLTAPLPELPQVQPARQPISKITRGLTALFLTLSACTMGLYMHTVRIEGEANRQQGEIRNLKEGNHYLQVQLAQTTNLERIETEATEKLKMVPRDDSVFLALPKEVSDLAQKRIVPGREPSPTPVFPGF